MSYPFQAIENLGENKTRQVTVLDILPADEGAYAIIVTPENQIEELPLFHSKLRWVLSFHSSIGR